MGKRYLAFDIETAKVLPEDVSDLLAHRPLGICCAAAFALGSGEQFTWHGKRDDGSPAPRVTESDARMLVDDLHRLQADGYTLVTWNGLSFDFNILGEEANAQARCAQLALDHVDMMFHFVCSQGHFLSLQKAAEGMELPGKLSGVISGAQAPRMWAEGQHEEVLAYNVQDVRVTAELAAACEHAQELRWITQRGRASAMPLPNGWLTVREARSLPEPDTSWMTNPPARDSFFSWMPTDAST